jgi:hypothetical protein
MIASQAVEDFGRIMGLDDLSLHPVGHCTLACADEADIGIDTDACDEDGLVVSISRPAPFVTASELLIALQSCDARRPSNSPPVSAALQGSGSDARIICATRLSRPRLTGQEIAAAVDRLQTWQRSWRDATGRND